MGGVIGRAAAVDHAPDAEATALRLAVLLQAGASPAAAWAHLMAGRERDAEAARRQGSGAGENVGEAMRALGGAWSEIAAAWDVAVIVGAPLAATLRAVSRALRDARQASDDARVALAEPAGTARLLMWLPLGGLVLGGLLGFDTVAVLVGSPTGWALVAGGGLLIAIARAWVRALVRRASAPAGIPGLDAELLAVALSGGASIDRAQALVESTGRTVRASTLEVLALSRSLGVPAVELLRADAAHERDLARTQGRLRAVALGSRLLLPLGVCTLPAFVLLGVAPLALSILSTAELPL